MKLKLKESDVQRACLDLLAYLKIPAWRMNTGAVSGDHNGKKRFFRFGVKGMADILAAPKTSRGGKLWIDVPAFLWVECKATGGKQSAEQKAFREFVEANGMSYLLVDDLDALSGWLKENGVVPHGC